MPAIEVRDLTIAYGGTTAVDGLSFEARAGLVTALLGPNGAGKTSTVEALEGYRRPSSGTVRVLGLDPVADHAAVVPSIGVMLQSGGVYPGIRPLEALRLHASFYRSPLDPEALLERVGALPSFAGALIQGAMVPVFQGAMLRLFWTRPNGAAEYGVLAIVAPLMGSLLLG